MMAPSPRIPLDPASSKPDEHRTGRSLAGARILLADHDAATRGTLTRVLTEHGCDVDAVANAPAALESARRSPPDLVLSDASMAGLDGLDLVTILRSDPKLALVPIILMAGRADEDTWANGVAVGADDYLGKPVAARELLNRVSGHIALSRLRHAAADRLRRTYITVRKHAEKRLKHSEAYLSAILQQLPIGVAVFDPAGLLSLCNDAFRDFTREVPSRASDGAGRWYAVHDDGSSVALEDYPSRRAQRGETGVSGIGFLHRQPDVGTAWTRISAGPLRDEKGTITGAIETIQHIDRTRQADFALRTSELRLRQFLDNSSHVFWIVDVESTRLDYVSPASEAIWGRPGATIVDVAGWTDTVHPDDRTFALAALDRSRDGEVVVDKYRIIRPDRSVRWIRHTFFPMRDGHGRVQRIGGIAEDITRSNGAQVYVVDGDDQSRRHLTQRLRKGGYEVKNFSSARAFLDVASVLVPGCVVLDIRSLATERRTLLHELKARFLRLPVIVTGGSQGDVEIAVQAMKAGAADWLGMPNDEDVLFAAVASSIAVIRVQTQAGRDVENARSRIARMTPRERDVLDGLVAGETNKAIARRLGISPRTVELHRARVMERLGAHTLPEAVLLAASVGQRGEDQPPA